jgi:hypothetical protein
MGKWSNFENYLFRNDELKITINFSQIGFSESIGIKCQKKIVIAYLEMIVLEAGEITKKNKNRMVGHY